jgi:hypothetical protein
MKLIPRCHPYRFDTKQPTTQHQALAYSAKGYLLPCCWCDVEIIRDRDDSRKEFEQLGLLDPSLKLEAVQSVEEILLSPQWKSFHRILVEEPSRAPTVCQTKCDQSTYHE